MTSREDALRAMLHDAGWADADHAPLDADCSFRRYIRLRRNGETRMLMDAPPPKEDVRPFLRVARLLGDHGFSAPAILAADEEAGFLLLEDFGDTTYTRALAAGVDERSLYEAATDVLVDLIVRAPAIGGLPEYDVARFTAELDLFSEWYLPAIKGRRDARLVEEFRALWRPILGSLIERQPRALVLRDYHVDNLMVLDRQGVRAVGLLDFQDAVAGPALYDFMSLVRDARRDVPADLAATLARPIRAALPGLSDADFAAAMAVLSCQRALKVLGIFTRQAVLHGRPVYLPHIPRQWRMIEEDLRHPALAPIAAWLDQIVPRTERRIPAMAGPA